MHTAVYKRQSQCVPCFGKTKGALSKMHLGLGVGGTPDYGLHVEAPPKRVAFFRLGCWENTQEACRSLA